MNSQKSILKIIILTIGIGLFFSCKEDADVISPEDVEKWSYYNIENGLPSNQINCITEDGFNNIWIGTNKGLVKYDGVNFSIYSTNTGLPSDSIYCLYWNSNAELLVGTHNGFGRINSFGQYSNIVKSTNLVCSNFSEDKQYGYTYCATIKGLYEYSITLRAPGYLSVDSTFRYGKYIPDAIYDITFDNNNNLWVAAEKGIYVSENSKPKFYSKDRLDIILFSSMGLFTDHGGRVWILPSLDQKVIYYDGSKFVNDSIFFGMNNFKSITQDGFKNYWISVWGHGVLNYAGGMTKVYQTSNSKIISDDINDILCDSKGNIWLGSNDKGLMHLQNIKPIQFSFGPEHNSKPNINPIY